MQKLKESKLCQCTLLYLYLFLFILFLPINVFSDPLKKIIHDFSGDIKANSIQNVAVMEFSHADKNLKNIAVLLQQRLITYLVRSKSVQVVDRSNLQKILTEIELNQKGITDHEKRRMIGRVLGVQAIITGTLSPLNSSDIEINARLIEIESTRILSAKRVSFSIKSLDDKFIYSNLNQGKIFGKPWIQVAILLDTSNSMDGLILQAKTQLWKIVNELASAEKDGNNPTVEIAIYEYGNSKLSVSNGYIRQVLSFSKDLDKVSESLFSLKTRGGKEYCGAVIQDAIMRLRWKEYSDVYKVIFIAGNESFSQGPVEYKRAIRYARQKGVFVNTIFCGNRSQGIATFWEAGAIAGNGQYMFIEQQTIHRTVQTPYDREITKLGSNINETYIPYGTKARESASRQKMQDKKAGSFAASGALVERSLFKAKKQYSRQDWDLSNLYSTGKIKIKDIDKTRLPKSLQKLSDKEIEKIIAKKIARRKEIQDKINNLNEKRKVFIAKKEKESRAGSKSESLEKVMRKSIRSQAGKMDYKFK